MSADNSVLFVNARLVDPVAGSDTGSNRGCLRVADGKNGEILAFIPDQSGGERGTLAAEGVAVDRDGIIYGAEVGPRSLKRYVRR